jgi:hypothetical protein
MFSTCICEDIDYWDSVSLGSPHRKARKEHICGECRGTIQPGEVYEVAKLLYDGTITTHKTCLPCVSVRSSLFKCGWYYGDIWLTIHEQYCGYEHEEDCFCICPDTLKRKR